jgi:hypothetical protein
LLRFAAPSIDRLARSVTSCADRRVRRLDRPHHSKQQCE